MEYSVVENNSLEIMVDSVQKLVSEGWIPTGGLSSTSETIQVPSPVSQFERMDVVQNTFYQAMTRTCKPKSFKKVSSLQPGKVVDLWNDLARAKKLPSKIKVTSALENTIRTRINEKDGFPGIGEWESYFMAISRSDFLTGINDRNWKATLEWAVKPKSIAGVIEGKYHNG